MSKTWCLTKEKADEFKKMLVSGKINPAKLNTMTSAERQAFFTKNFGEANAKNINALFEKKLLLKNQKQGMITWAKNVLKDKPREQRSALNRINKLNEALDKKELDTFLGDLAEERVGFQITEDQFTKLSELGKDAKEKRAITLEKMENGKWKSEADKNKYGIDFGASKVAFDNYYSQLAETAKGKPLKNVIETYKNQGIINGTYVGLETSINFIAENSRALVASWDNSFWGRQGRKALGRYATSRDWFKNFGKSFVDATNILVKGKQKGAEIMDSIKTEIYSRENYLNGRYEKGVKLDVGVREEEFPTSFPARIPAIGRLFTISEVVYEGGATRLRADIADKFYEMGEKVGVNLKDNTEVGAINDQVNIMTGRGSLGSFENAGKQLNKVFFSVKFAASQIQTITKLKTAKTKFARKQAAINLASLVASSATMFGMMYMLWPDRVEVDTRSSNFGKIRIGNQWIDITGGSASYLVAAERRRRQAYKNTYTGVITKLNDGYGTPDGMDVFFDFWQNKTSPFASVVKDIIRQRTFEGDRPTVFTEVKSLMIPIIVETGKESYEQKNQISDMIIAVIADGIGLSVSNYIFQTNWSTNTSKEITEFREQVGEKKFKEANNEYNQRVAEMYLQLEADERYQKMNNDERRKELTKRKGKIKKKVIFDYK